MTNSSQMEPRAQMFKDIRMPRQELSFGNLVEEYYNPAATKMTIVLISLSVIGFLVWASLSPVHEIVIAQGKIQPQGFVHKVQHFEGGNVREILVKEGDEVEKGDVIARLDSVRIGAELEKAEANLEAVELSTLRSTAFVSGDTYELRGSLSRDGLVNSQQSALTQDDAYRDARLATVQKEINRLEIEAGGAQARYEKSQEELDLLNNQLADYELAYKHGAVSKLERDNIKREVIQLKSRVEDNYSNLQAIKASISLSIAKKDEIVAELRQKATLELTSFELSKIEAEEQVRQLRDRLKHLEIKSPSSGVVQLLAVHNVGQVIGAGDVIAEIVPFSGKPLAEVEVPADQVGFLQIGMPANVKILTFDFTRFGVVEGRITDISPTSFEKQDGTRFFRVRLELLDDAVAGVGDGGQIKPGMTLTADIRQSSKSVLSYLLKPLRVLNDRALTEP